MEAVEHHVTYGFRREDGTCLRDHFEQAGVAIDDPVVSVAGQDILEKFWELNEARQNNGWDVLPLTNQEIQAWRENRRLSPLTDWEYRALRSMDRRYRETVQKITKELENGRSRNTGR